MWCDDFLRSRFDRRYAAVVYATILTKTTFWTSEEEIRFLSKRQGLEVVIEDSAVTQVTVGQHVAPSGVARIREIAGLFLWYASCWTPKQNVWCELTGTWVTLCF